MSNTNTVDDSVRKTKRWRQLFVVAAKVVAGLLILYALFQSDLLNLEPLTTLSWSLATAGVVAGALAAVGIAVALLAVRLRVLLAQQEVFVSAPRTFAFTLIGMFFGVILPGILAGDVVKAVYLCDGERCQLGRVVSTMVVDRVIGLYSFLLLGAFASLLAMLHGIKAVPAYIMQGAILLAVLATVLFFSSRLCVRTKWFDRLTAKLPRRLVSMVRMLSEYLHRPSALLAALCLSLVANAMVVSSFFMMAILLHDPLPLTTHFVVNPLAMVMNAVPLTPGGIGITEGAFAYLYEWCGSPNGAMVGLMGRIIQYLIFIVGGVIAMLFTRVRIKDLLTISRQEQ